MLAVAVAVADVKTRDRLSSVIPITVHGHVHFMPLASYRGPAATDRFLICQDISAPRLHGPACVSTLRGPTARISRR